MFSRRFKVAAGGKVAALEVSAEGEVVESPALETVEACLDVFFCDLCL